MKKEIERKFLIESMPDLGNIKPQIYERHFLSRNPSSEIRIQKKGEKYEFERKEKINNLMSKKDKFEITKEKFFKLKENSKGIISRESYLLSKNPEISIKIYHGKFEGLKRVEVEFENEVEAHEFKPLVWFGKEITDSPLGSDSKLADLSKIEFENLNRL